MAEWRNGGMVEWWNDGMAEWRNGGMAEWRNGGMAEWHNVQYEIVWNQDTESTQMPPWRSPSRLVQFKFLNCIRSICIKTNTNLLYTNSIHSILHKIGHVIQIVVHQFLQKTSAEKNSCL